MGQREEKHRPPLSSCGSHSQETLCHSGVRKPLAPIHLPLRSLLLDLRYKSKVLSLFRSRSANTPCLHLLTDCRSKTPSAAKISSYNWLAPKSKSPFSYVYANLKWKSTQETKRKDHFTVGFKSLELGAWEIFPNYCEQSWQVNMLSRLHPNGAPR